MNKTGAFLVSLSLILLSACAPSSSEVASNSGNANENANKQTGNTTASNEVITISWWDPINVTNTVAQMDKIFAEYEKEHPNVKINRTYIPNTDYKKKVLMSHAGNQLPDILWVDSPEHQSMAAAGIFSDLTEEVKSWEFKDQFFSGPWASTVYKEKNYGIPVYSNNLALFYNEDMLKEAGVTPPTNWEELKTAAQKLTKPGVSGFIASAIKTEHGLFQFLPFVWQAGSDLTNFNSPGTIEALNLWKEMIDNGSMTKEVLGLDQSNTALTFISGKAAMMVNGPWQFPNLAKDAKFKWGVVTLPGHKQDATILGGYNYGVSSNTKHKDIAWDIIKFAEESERKKELLKATGHLPARKDLITDPVWANNPNFKVFADGMEVAKPRAYGADYLKISEYAQDVMQQVFTGSKSAEDAVKEADAKIKPLLP